MSDWATSTDPCTWGGLVAHAIEFGATLEKLEDCAFPESETRAVLFLLRIKDGVRHHFPLPHNCHPSDRVGPWKWMKACSRLEIPRPNDWAVEL